MNSPYSVRNGMYCDEVSRHETFEEALAAFRRLKHPRPREWRVIDLVNLDRVDIDDSSGLTDEEEDELSEARYQLWLAMRAEEEARAKAVELFRSSELAARGAS